MKRKIDFDRDGLTLVGNLFTPEGFDETSNYQAVIVEGSFTSVKELMAGTYARKFAEQGFVALAFGYGRQPGWSLALNPTPALLVEHGPEALARLAGRGVAAPAEPLSDAESRVAAVMAGRRTKAIQQIVAHAAAGNSTTPTESPSAQQHRHREGPTRGR